MMQIILIGPEFSFARNLLGGLIAVILVPIVLVFKIALWPFSRPMDRSVEEVVRYLQGRVDGTIDDSEWDDFISVPIADPDLESIRNRAVDLDMQAVEAGDNIVFEPLLAEARAIALSEELTP